MAKRAGNFGKNAVARQGKTTDMNAFVARKVKERCNYIGMTQTALGEAIGVTYGQAHKYLNNINRMGAGRLLNIAETLGVEIDFFYDFPAYEMLPETRMKIDLWNCISEIAGSGPDAESKLSKILKAAEAAANKKPQAATQKIETQPATDHRKANDIDTLVGRRIRARRISLGISQEELFLAVGINFAQGQRLEKGKNRLSHHRLFEIAEILRIGINHFFTDFSDEEAGHHKMPERPRIVTEFRRNLKKVPKRKVKILREALTDLDTAERLLRTAQLTLRPA